MIKLKSYISAASLAIFTLLVSTSASAETCGSLYEDGLYEEALPLCLKAKDNFRLGVIYSRLNDCQNMKKYYLRSGASAKGNMGMHLLFGNRGCEKDVQRGLQFLEQAIKGGRLGFSDILGDHYREIGNKEMAKVHYRKSVNNKAANDWDVDRARDSYSQLIKLLNGKELKKFYIEKINAPINATDWEEEMASKAINGLKGILDTKEKLSLLLENTASKAKYKCEIGANLYNSDFQGLVKELAKQNKTRTFISRLCKGDKEYFIGKTFENGLGNKEDLQEAYRLYLIAGANGNESAKAARDRIRDQLTPEQIQEAVCLADYGLIPSYLNKVLCKF